MKIEKHIKILSYSALLLAMLASHAFVAKADTSQVENTVSVSVSTGGNTASGGEVVEGKRSANVSIKTIVDGKTIESIDKHYGDSDGEEKEIKYESYYKNDGVEVQSTVLVGNGNESTTSDTSLFLPSFFRSLFNFEQSVQEESYDSVSKNSEEVSKKSAEVKDTEKDVAKAVKNGDVGYEETDKKEENSKSKVIKLFISNIINYVFNIFQ